MKGNMDTKRIQLIWDYSEDISTDRATTSRDYDNVERAIDALVAGCRVGWWKYGEIKVGNDIVARGSRSEDSSGGDTGPVASVHRYRVPGGPGERVYIERR